MIFKDIHEVAPTVERAVVINVATEIVSAVAIASALRNAGMPLLVINCTPHGPGKPLMDELSRQWNFDLVDLQLVDHGVALDRLFNAIHADRILLIDSDAEIKSRTVTANMRAGFSDPTTYGAGWVHDAVWLSSLESGISIGGADAPIVYRERPWIPCAMFRTSFIRAALQDGISFKESFVMGSHILALGLAPKFVEGGTPLGVHNDTGAEIHGWATGKGFRFDGPSVHTITDEVAHHHGVTRSVLGSENSTALSAVESIALERLREAYPEYWTGFTSAVATAQALL